ncbi:hypothetical protein [Streptomyces bambusae]|uniref:hypothetical protein n=1 Tax=Streptomyces bambusae TaxID=1550616 RepID=UPI002155ACD9|nr:hypothetical protein [Streptomyces bambusae]
MPTHTTDEDSLTSPISFWPRVRDYAVPPSMIETATARRSVGDWAGACAAAGIDVDLRLGVLARTHGRELAARVRADLRHLAPDLLRWHLPRIAPDGLLRPGLTIALARYDGAGRDGGDPVHLVVRTPPAWADGGQRISLALWDGSRTGTAARSHPHPHPSRRFRFDLHRHLWDARRAGDLRIRSGADRPPGQDPPGQDPPGQDPPGQDPYGPVPGLPATAPGGLPCAVDRWAAEAELLLRAEGRRGGAVEVRLGGRHRLVLDLVTDPDGTRPPELHTAAAPADEGGPALPVLPDPATWVLPDLELLRAGLIGPDRLHPLVAAALVPGHVPAGPAPATDPAGAPRFVDCRGDRHRIALVDGVLTALDHGPDELRREELLVALTGTPLPCLRAIDEAHRRPQSLSGIRERLVHGDTAGALAVVEGLLGPDAVLRDGALRDELEAAAGRRVTYGLFRSGLLGPGQGCSPVTGYVGPRSRPPDRRSRPRHADLR